MFGAHRLHWLVHNCRKWATVYHTTTVSRSLLDTWHEHKPDAVRCASYIPSVFAANIVDTPDLLFEASVQMSAPYLAITYRGINYPREAEHTRKDAMSSQSRSDEMRCAIMARSGT